MVIIKQDNAAVARVLEDGVKAIMNELLDDTIQDLDGPIREVAGLLTAAIRHKNTALVGEARDQIAMLAIEKRKRWEVQGDGMFDMVLGLGLSALLNGAIAGLGGLKAV